jgi:hypothetical protein
MVSRAITKSSTCPLRALALPRLNCPIAALPMAKVLRAIAPSTRAPTAVAPIAIAPPGALLATGGSPEPAVQFSPCPSVRRHPCLLSCAAKKHSAHSVSCGCHTQGYRQQSVPHRRSVCVAVRWPSLPIRFLNRSQIYRPGQHRTAPNLSNRRQLCALVDPTDHQSIS